MKISLNENLAKHQDTLIEQSVLQIIQNILTRNTFCIILNYGEVDT